MSDTNMLAVNGGPKALTRPWPARHLYDEREKQAVVALFDEVIETGKELWYNGEQEEAYCREFAEFHGGGYVDAVNSGTSAVYVALRVLELEPFTEVIVPPITDAGGVMPVPLINCIPVPADSAPGLMNAGPEQIEARITDRTSAIIVAHIAGNPVDMDPVMEIARRHGIPVIEDCSQAHGATYKGRLVGTFGDVAAFSTMGGKHHATGPQGGIVLVRDEELYWRARRYSDRGKPFGIEEWRGAEGANLVCSLNLNLNDLAACIGRVQLKKLPAAIERRRRFALAVAEGCKSLETMSVQMGLPETESAVWFMFLRLELEKISVDKETFVDALKAEGLPVAPSYLHIIANATWYKNRAVFGTSGYPWTCPLYKGDPDAEYPMPNAIAANDSLFSLWIHEHLDEQDISGTLAALTKVEKAFLK